MGAGELKTEIWLVRYKNLGDFEENKNLKER